MDAAGLRTGDPERLGGYTLTGRLGQGGQGSVFLGVASDGRQVAVKLLHAELTADERARARFLRELETAKRVAGFCTAQVIDADLAGDRPYIVSEYVPGPSLARRVAEQGPLAGAALDRLAVGTMTALVAIHQAGIVHRDFKPHNVLIGPDGPRVIDFGVARAISGAATLTSRAIGTPAYMAPEQLRGEEVGTPADMFCWAATIVFAATGRPPFGQDTIPAVIHRILHAEPDLGDLTGTPAELAAACLVKDAAERPDAGTVLMRLLGRGPAAPPRPRPAADAAEVPAESAADGATRIDPSRSAPHRPAAGEPEPEPERTDPVRLPTPAEWAHENELSPAVTQDARDARDTGPARPVRSSPLRPVAVAGAVAVLLLASGAAGFALRGDGGTGRTVGGDGTGTGTGQVVRPPQRQVVPQPGDGTFRRPSAGPYRPSPAPSVGPTGSASATSGPTGGPSGSPGGPTTPPGEPRPTVTSTGAEPTPTVPAGG